VQNRETALRNLAIGDIFHASAPNGASIVCLVTSVDPNKISARRIHTQENLEFDRQTGIESGNASVHSRIDSVAPLPPDVHEVFLSMDRKYGDFSRDVKRGFRLEDNPERLKLTPAEQRALLFLDSHYSSNPV
jgi:hypothetical protein